MSERRVVIYSSPTCRPCKATKEFLSSKGIAFTDIDVVNDGEGREELIRRTGQTAVPVIVVGDEVVVGFDRARLSQLLGLG